MKDPKELDDPQLFDDPSYLMIPSYSMIQPQYFSQLLLNQLSMDWHKVIYFELCREPCNRCNT